MLFSASRRHAEFMVDDAHRSAKSESLVMKVARGLS